MEHPTAQHGSGQKQIHTIMNTTPETRVEAGSAASRTCPASETKQGIVSPPPHDASRAAASSSSSAQSSEYTDLHTCVHVLFGMFSSPQWFPIAPVSPSPQTTALATICRVQDGSCPREDYIDGAPPTVSAAWAAAKVKARCAVLRCTVLFAMCARADISRMQESTCLVRQP